MATAIPLVRRSSFSSTAQSYLGFWQAEFRVSLSLCHHESQVEEEAYEEIEEETPKDEAEIQVEADRRGSFLTRALYEL
ncbi:hypothetical protein I3760_14G059000 [Carya illinoinensis]|nr:hypothetical protein I3760_14G059000 [Carya illinoinensis]